MFPAFSIHIKKKCITHTNVCAHNLEIRGLILTKLFTVQQDNQGNTYSKSYKDPQVVLQERFWCTEFYYDMTLS